MKNRTIAYLWLSTVSLAGNVPAAGKALLQPPASRWQVTHPHPARPGLQFSSDAQPRIRFISQSMSTAITPWEAGTRPCAFSFGVDIEKGNRQPWRWPGVFVALLSARPDEMTENDVALCMSVHLQGAMAAVRKGGFFRAYEQRPGVWRWKDRNEAPRYTLNMGGAGGHDYSIQWPGKALDETRLYFRLERKPANEVVFSLYHRDGGNTPWWTGSYVLPAGPAGVPLKWVAVKTMVHQGDPDKPVRDADLLHGSLFEMRGSTTVGGATPPFKPFDEPPPVDPRLRDHSGFPHPCLWFKSEQLADLRRKFNEPLFSPYKDLILGYAEKPQEEIGKFGTPSHAAIIHAYLWAYLLGEKPEHKARLLETVDALLVGTDQLPGLQHGHPGRWRKVIKIDEFMCHNAEAVASVYDALFRELTPEQRTRMFRYLQRHLAYYLERLKRNDWWYRNNPSNTIAVGNGCNGIAALVLRPLVPEAEGAVRLAVKTIHEKYQAMADDGSCVEGNLYWDYGFTYQLLFGHALRNVLGDDRGLLSSPALNRAPRFVETQLGGDGRYLTFNDTQPWLTGLGVCADFGSRLDSPLLRWMADRSVREAVDGTVPIFTRPQFCAFAFRVRDSVPAPDMFPGVPAMAYLETLNWGVLRSDGAFKPAIVVGVKGRDGATTHHAQEDMPGFTLQVHGEGFIIDPGYYQPKAAHHSIPLVDGKGPNGRGRALITEAWEEGPLRTMTVDATDAYKATGATRVRRTFVVCDSKAVVVLDDIVPGPVGEGVVTAQYQCGFPVRLADDQAALVVLGERSSLALEPLFPGLKLAVKGPIDFGRSWVFKETGVEWYRVRGAYKANPGQPLVTVFQPVKGTQAPSVVSLARGATALAVILAGQADPIVRFKRTDAGWITVKE